MNLTYFLSYIPFFMCKTMLSVQHKGNHNNSAWLCRWSIAAWQEKITPLPLILACSVALQERALNTKGKKKKKKKKKRGFCYRLYNFLPLYKKCKFSELVSSCSAYISQLCKYLFKTHM